MPSTKNIVQIHFMCSRGLDLQSPGHLAFLFESNLINTKLSKHEFNKFGDYINNKGASSLVFWMEFFSASIPLYFIVILCQIAWKYRNSLKKHSKVRLNWRILEPKVSVARCQLLNFYIVLRRYHCCWIFLDF